jgi:hypothetical protein
LLLTGGAVPNEKPSKKAELLAEVMGVGGGHSQESALGTRKEPQAARKPIGRPSKEPTIPFTLRLRSGAAELLQALVSDLQARAVRGEFPRSEATIGTVVEQSLELYAQKHGFKKEKQGF